jgi:hypothetical protein
MDSNKPTQQQPPALFDPKQVQYIDLSSEEDDDY